MSTRTLVIIGVGAGVWFFFLREPSVEADGKAIPLKPTPDPAPAQPPGYAVTNVPGRVAAKRRTGAAVAATSSKLEQVKTAKKVASRTTPEWLAARAAASAKRGAQRTRPAAA